MSLQELPKTAATTTLKLVRVPVDLAGKAREAVEKQFGGGNEAAPVEEPAVEPTKAKTAKPKATPEEACGEEEARGEEAGGQEAGCEEARDQEADRRQRRVLADADEHRTGRRARRGDRRADRRTR